MRIAICDDIPRERQIVTLALGKVFAARGEKPELVEYPSGERLAFDFEDGAVFDLIFLDIYMDGISGIETASQLRRLGFTGKLIFLTTAPDFAAESYEVEAAGYLLKPLQPDKLAVLIERLLSPVQRQRVALPIGGSHRYIFLDTIVWVESRDHQLEVHQADGTVLRIRGKLGDIEAAIHHQDFLRCHQSFLINMNYVDHLDECFRLRTGDQIPIRVRSRRQIGDQYHQWFLDKHTGA